MKIVHIIMSLNIGGAELMLKRLVLHSHKKEQFEHIVITLTDLGVMGPELQNAGVIVHTLGMKSLPTVPLIFLKLRRLLKKIQPDVVQTWMYHSDLLGGLAAKSIGIKKIIWGIRNTDVSQCSSKLTVYLSKLCAKLSYYIPTTIICAANVSKNYHIKIGYDESKMVVISNGYDIDAISATNKDGLEIRRQNNLSTNDIVIGSVGRFDKAKNQKLFVDIAAILIKDYPDLKFMIVGRDNTVENAELISWIKSYNIVDNFRLLGERDDVPKCLKAMDIFCLHSKTEGFPNVLVEALAAGLLCVSADVGDARQILDKYGSLVTEYNSLGLVAAIKHNIIQLDGSDKIIENNKNLALKHVRDNYSIENIHIDFSNIWKA